MRVSVVKKLEFPRDVPEEYKVVWDKLIETKAFRELRLLDNKDAIQDCFRLIVKQAGAKVKLLNSVNDYIELNSHVKDLRAFMRKYDIGRNMRVRSHKRSLTFSVSELTCSIIRPSFEGIVVLTPQRFDLNYHVNRLKVLLYKEVPYPLSDKKPNGAPKRFLSVQSLRDTDYYLAHDSEHVKVFMYRTKKNLIVRYVCSPAVTVLPKFKNVEKELKSIWRKSTDGVMQ